jgi:carbamoylphosphate synthase large subunit
MGGIYMRVLLLGAALKSSVYNSTYKYLIDKGYETIGINGYQKINNNLHNYYEDPLPIINFVKQMGIKGVICLSTERSLNRDAIIKKELESKGIKVIANPPSVIEIFNHKGKTRKYCKENNISIVPGRNFLKTSEIINVANELGYPIVIKKPSLTGGIGLSFINNEKDLERYYKDYNSEDDLVVEKFISGIEFSIEVIGIDGVYRSLPPIYKGETGKGIHPLDKIRVIPYWDTILNKQMEDISIKVAKDLNICGTIELELILEHKSGILYLMEVNPRMGGVTNLGINYSRGNTAFALVDMLEGFWKNSEIITRNRVGIELHLNKKVTKEMIVEIKKLNSFSEVVYRNRVDSIGSVILAGKPDNVLSDIEGHSSYFNNYEEAVLILRSFPNR